MASGEVIWEPTAEQIEGSRLHGVMRRAGVGNYEDFYRLSVDEPSEFWKATLDDLGIEWFRPYERFVDLSRGPQWPRWFVGGELNLAHNALTRHAMGPPREETALIWEGDGGESATLTWQELESETSHLATVLAELGVGLGDRVGIFLPMIPQAAMAVLAVARLGAIVVPLFSGYGPEAVASRLRDCEARLLITADGFRRRGKVVQMKAVADEAAQSLPALTRVLMVPHLGIEVNLEPGRDILWESNGSGHDGGAPMASLDANTPFMLAYTSGSSGKAKATVHVHGGFPFKMSQDFTQLFDLKQRDVLLWTTDLGWVMGPAVVICGLTIGATIVMYSGAPDYPDAGRLWRLVERHGVTHLGLSPTLVRQLRAQGGDSVNQSDLSSLRVLPSTGEPWDEDSYRWYFRNVAKGRAPISNFSGGTEIGGGILGCVLVRPIKVAGFNTAVPGIAADVLDGEGKPIVGALGELAILKPFVGMTQGFWGESDLYLEAYWRRFPDIWVQGDSAVREADGHWFVVGRSDDTIKVAGKRIGPAEIEAVANQHSAVAQAAAIGVPHKIKGSAIVVFVTERSGMKSPDDLPGELSAAVAKALGKSLAPQAVYVVGDLPRTRNGKILRRLIRSTYLGEKSGDMSSLENPEALELIAALGFAE